MRPPRHRLYRAAHQPPQQGHALHPVARRLGRVAAPTRPGGNVRHDAGSARRARHRRQSRYGRRCPPARAIMTKSPTLHAAGYAGLRDNQAVPPDGDVVRDLDEIVDLGALPDDRVPGRAAVDRGVGADFHVVLNDDAAGLRDFLMALRARQIAEAVLPDAGTGMDDHAIADQARGGSWRRRRSRNRGRSRHPGRSPRRPRSRCRPRSRLAARSRRADRRSRRFRAAPSGCTCAPAASRRWRRTATTGAVRRETARARPRRRRGMARRHQHGESARRGGREARRNEAGAGARDGERGEIFWTVEKADVGGARRVERSDIADAPVERNAVTRLGLRELGDLPDRQLACSVEGKSGMGPSVTGARGRDQNCVPPPNGTIGSGRNSASGTDRRNRTAMDRTANPRSCWRRPTRARRRCRHIHPALADEAAERRCHDAVDFSGRRRLRLSLVAPHRPESTNTAPRKPESLGRK